MNYARALVPFGCLALACCGFSYRDGREVGGDLLGVAPPNNAQPVTALAAVEVDRRLTRLCTLFPVARQASCLVAVLQP